MSVAGWQVRLVDSRRAADRCPAASTEAPDRRLVDVFQPTTDRKAVVRAVPRRAAVGDRLVNGTSGAVRAPGAGVVARRSTELLGVSVMRRDEGRVVQLLATTGVRVQHLAEYSRVVHVFAA